MQNLTDSVHILISFVFGGPVVNCTHKNVGEFISASLMNGRVAIPRKAKCMYWDEFPAGKFFRQVGDVKAVDTSDKCKQGLFEWQSAEFISPQTKTIKSPHPPLIRRLAACQRWISPAESRREFTAERPVWQAWLQTSTYLKCLCPVIVSCSWLNLTSALAWPSFSWPYSLQASIILH